MKNSPALYSVLNIFRDMWMEQMKFVFNILDDYLEPAGRRSLNRFEHSNVLHHWSCCINSLWWYYVLIRTMSINKKQLFILHLSVYQINPTVSATPIGFVFVHSGQEPPCHIYYYLIFMLLLVSLVG